MECKLPSELQWKHGVDDDDDDGDDDDDDDSGIVLPWRGEDKEERQLQRQ